MTRLTVGRLAWEFIGYEEYRLAWNKMAAQPKDILRKMACDKLEERVELAMDTYGGTDYSRTRSLNAWYVMGLNEFLRYLSEVRALEEDESEPQQAWQRVIGPPWEEFEYEEVPRYWRVSTPAPCDACGEFITQETTMFLCQDMVQEHWFCSLDCARWHRREIFRKMPQLAVFLEQPCPLVMPWPTTTADILAYWLTIPKLLGTDRDPDPVDYIAAQPERKPRISKAVRIRKQPLATGESHGEETGPPAPPLEAG